MNSHRILFVDDEPSLRTVTRAVLESEGYLVDCAEDGYEGLKAIQRNCPDLIISDLRMPNMNGFEFLSIVRTRFPHIPTIAISGEFCGPQVRESLLADAFFQKGSYSPKDLFAKISALLSHAAKSIVPSRTPEIWPSTRDSAAMLTCPECLRSFPLESAREDDSQMSCLLCGAQFAR